MPEPEIGKEVKQKSELGSVKFEVKNMVEVSADFVTSSIVTWNLESWVDTVGS